MNDRFDPRRLRVASGIDVHPFVEGRALILGGVHIDHPRGLAGHSDADAIAHAVMDAVLGAAGLDDIGSYFPSDDASLAGADSLQLLRMAMRDIRARGCEPINVDVVVALQSPRLAPHRVAIRSNLAEALGLAEQCVTVRATTTDRLGFVGREEGVAAFATCLAVSAPLPLAVGTHLAEER